MKYCTDCAYSDLYRCRAPQHMTTNPVDGSLIPRFFTTCNGHRFGEFTGWFWCRVLRICGKEGRWFKQYKETT
jgi:hypothetical protein